MQPGVSQPSSKRYRILLIGDYSNLHARLCATLRTMGHDVTLMSDGCGFQDTARDINVRRHSGRAGGALLALQARTVWRKYMRGNDIVVLQNPQFLPLRPARLMPILQFLRNENQRLYLTAAGNDVPYLQMLLSDKSPVAYSEWRINGSPGPLARMYPDRLAQWLSPEMVRYNDMFYNMLDGAVSALYEYHPAIMQRLGNSRVAYGGIPVDTDTVVPFDAADATNVPYVNFFLGRHRGRYAEKGTDLLARAARRACALAGAHLHIVENVPYEQYIQTMRGCNVMLDQIYSYTPATNALLGMARGMAVVSGGEEDFYNFIGEKSLRPIVNAPYDEEQLTQTLVHLAKRPDEVAMRGAEGREFVKRHNHHKIVAQRYLDFWTDNGAL